jgi:hypothetical protein
MKQGKHNSTSSPRIAPLLELSPPVFPSIATPNILKKTR